ncbi:hypothetical protein IMSHALPRED_006464 [Imshaugia aleurites]|uniref:RNA-dependent RNA polymerase n=1 Tax=Imshaugia aleurites TaxID=172621 RepID=A0A8H3IT79_9LECA|nr:hypothetical protein IMSHALPRED_006464 [Imshaugia aleurites]
MAKSNAFSLVITLQNSINPDDCEWSYSTLNTPKSSYFNSLGLIKSVSVVSNAKEQTIILRFTKASPNRATANDPLDKFISISFAAFHLRHPNGDPLAKGDEAPSSEAATPKESAEYVTRLLQSGLTINGVTYNFYGHSNSQLKSRTCSLFAAPKDEIACKVENLGDLATLKSVAKKVKRIGLLFSTAEIVCEVEVGCYEDIPDIFAKDYNFTDGCGLISEAFAKFLVKKKDLRFRNQKYMPSSFQIRYRGYKGVLMVDPTMKGKTKIKFRESMRKFKGGEDLSFSVIEYAKAREFSSSLTPLVLGTPTDD